MFGKSVKVGESAPCDYYAVLDSGGMENVKQFSTYERLPHDEINLRQRESQRHFLARLEMFSFRR